ncbi:hypothetical protein Q7P35_003264 [Cladosporium inversicolor]
MKQVPAITLLLPQQDLKLLHLTSTSSSQSARLFTPTTSKPRLRFRRASHFHPSHSGSAKPIHLPTNGLLLLPSAMAHPGQLYTKRTNQRGDVFFDYGGTPDQLTAEVCFSSDDSDENNNNNERGDIGDGQLEGLSGQFTGLGFRDADAGILGHRPRRRSEENCSTTSRSSNSQWVMDNLPTDGTRPHREPTSSTFRPSSSLQSETDNLSAGGARWLPNEESPGGSSVYEGGLSDEHMAHVALERAYKALALPIMRDVEGEPQHHMVQLAVRFIFRTLPWLNHIRGDLEQLGDLYDAYTLAEQFYVEHGAAIWGPGAVGDQEVDGARMARLEIFFNALRTQETTRDEAEAIGDKPLKQLVRLRRLTAAISRSVPSGNYPDGSLPALYAALEVQDADIWVSRAFQRAVAEMIIQALPHVRDPVVTSFPCSLPSGALIERVIERITSRYERKLWPDATARPEDTMAILHQYILALMKSKMTAKDIRENSVEWLDSLLGLKDGDAQERGDHVHDEPHDHDDLECALAHLAEHESCSQQFGSALELAEHLVEMHAWDEDLADEVAYDHFG